MQLSILSGSEKQCVVKGFPNFVNGKHIRTLYECQFLSDRDYSNQIQLSVFDSVTDKYNADNLIEGYSGSGIFMEVEGRTYVCGIAVAYEEASKRLICVNLSAANDIFLRHNLPVLNLIEIETDPVIIEDSRRLKENTEAVLSRIKDRIGNIKLPRIQPAEQLKSKIEISNLILVYGNPGLGKSALTKSVINNVSGEYEVIAFRGEDIDKASIAKVFEGLKIQTNPDALLNSKVFKKKKLVLIDSIEKLLESSSAETIIDFFELLRNRKDICLIITCRYYAVSQLQARFLQNFPRNPWKARGIVAACLLPAEWQKKEIGMLMIKAEFSIAAHARFSKESLFTSSRMSSADTDRR